MLLNSLKIIINCFKIDRGFASLIHKSKSSIITLDQQIIGNNEENNYFENVHQKSRRGINFYNHFDGKSIEGVDDKDERFSNAIINARNATNVDNDLMVLEGVNMIRDAIKMNASMISLFFTKRDFLQELPFMGHSTQAKVYYIRYRDMVKFSNLKTPPGLIAIFKRPNPEDMVTDVFLSKKLPLTLILDNIREPGNLGTIIRTAAGFNVSKVLLSKGCVDLYNEKVLRSSMSSLICVPTFHDLSWDTIGNSLHPECTVHYADISSDDHTDAFPYYHHHLIDFKNNKTYGLIIGGEIDGVSEEAKKLSEITHGCKITIPIIRRINSLNSAISAAILMSEFQKTFLIGK